MDIILDDFTADLSRLRRLLKLCELVRSFASGELPADGSGEFRSLISQLHNAAKESNADIVVLAGATVLYLGGRFEFFVKERFEELCDKIAAKCKCYHHLPKQMRHNLVRMTAEVMASPRKFGHAEKGVEAFVRNLAANMAATDGVADINRQCLSLTFENMRGSTLKDLFDRIGCKDVWTLISEQAGVKTYFETLQSSDARSKATEFLNDFMDRRNTIAHPSKAVDWPDVTKVLEYIDYFEMLATALCNVVTIYESTMPDPKELAKPAESAPVSTDRGTTTADTNIATADTEGNGGDEPV